MFLALAVCASCGQPDSTPLPRATPPISGAQLDAIQHDLRGAGLARAEWASVELSHDDTRAVVHARVDALDSDEARGDYCRTATAVMEAGLQDGQQIEIYLVDPDEGVYACRNQTK